MRQIFKQTVRVLSASFRDKQPLLSKLVKLTEEDIRFLGGKPEYWPSRTASDRQAYIPGIAFQRETRVGSKCHGEWLVIEKTKEGGRKSRAATPSEIQETRYIQQGIKDKRKQMEKQRQIARRMAQRDKS